MNKKNTWPIVVTVLVVLSILGQTAIIVTQMSNNTEAKPLRQIENSFNENENTENPVTPSDIMAKILRGPQASETTPAPPTQSTTPTQPVPPVQSARPVQSRENNTRINTPNNRRDFNMDRDELGGAIGDKFSETIPNQTHLVGFEISKGPARSSGEPLVSVQALYRSRDGEKQSKGKLYGQKSGDVERAYAPPGYAVGGLRGQAFGAVTGFELVFMKIRPDGTLDPNNTQTSDWIGGRDERLEPVS